MYAKPDFVEKFGNNNLNELAGAPFILPTLTSPLRKMVDEWFIQHGIAAKIVAECSDSALIKTTAAAGRGLFVAPTNIANDIERATGCIQVAEISEAKENYYGITSARVW